MKTRCWDVAAILLFSLNFCFAQTNDSDSIASRLLGALSRDSVALQNIDISAEETRLAFPKFSRLSKILNTDLDEERRASIEAFVNSGTRTNFSSHIYRFENGNLFISTKSQGPDTGMISESKVIVMPSEIWEFKSRTNEFNPGTKTDSFGEINRRQPRDTGSCPRFLTKVELFKWLSGASNLTFRAGSSLDDSNCYIAQFKDVKPGPIAKYQLFFNLVDLTPFAIASYLPDGSVYSITDLEYWQDESISSVCKHAKTQIFNGKDVEILCDWIITAPKKVTK